MRGPYAGCSANSGAVSDQRPCTCGRAGPAALGEPAAARCCWSRATVSRGARSGAHASFVTSPAQTRSQSASCSSAVSTSARSDEQVGPERRRRVASRSRIASWSGPCGGSPRFVGRPEPANVLAEVERHPARAAAERARADPDELAAGAELVEPGGRPAAEPARQDVALPGLGGERDALERHEHLAQAVEPGAAGRRGVDALPRGQEAGELLLLDGLDLLAQRGERRRAAGGAGRPGRTTRARARRAAARRGPGRRRARARAAPGRGSTP